MASPLPACICQGGCVCRTCVHVFTEVSIKMSFPKQNALVYIFIALFQSGLFLYHSNKNCTYG